MWLVTGCDIDRSHLGMLENSGSYSLDIILSLLRVSAQWVTMEYPISLSDDY